MKAIVYRRYGMPDELKLEEADKPFPKENEILIKVKAASINSWDWDLLRGEPFLNRLIGGVREPKNKILGCDISGVVEAIGTNVKKYKPGDEVYGDISGGSWGGFAEYVCADEKYLSIKPSGMPFDHAASIPQAGTLALQGLNYGGGITNRKKVLINGAGGGTGTFAIQMAKARGAEVTAVDKAEKLELMKTLGADYVIDYMKEDFTKNGKRYDFILDIWASRSLADYRRALNPGGVYAMIGGAMNSIFQAMLLGPFVSLAGNKILGIVFHKANKGLNEIEELYKAGKLKPIIEKCYPLEETPEAFRHIGDGRAKGKLVITI